MNNKEKVYAIIEKLEKGHINLWHDITKVDMLSYIEKIEWNNLDDVQFDFEMLKLFSKFKDGHTRYFIKNKTLKNKLIYKNEKVYILEGNKYFEVVRINDMSIKILIDIFETMVCYETNEWKNVQVEIAFNSYYFYTMLGMDEVYAYLDNGNKIKLEEASNEEMKARLKEFSPYSYKFMDDILYIKYSACRDDENISFLDFVNKIKTDIEALNTHKYILDLRGNKGGNSEILNPFQDLVREKKLEGILLIDSRVFSSGRFAVAKFKKEFNTLLVGMPTGGAASSYGYNNNDNVEDKSFSYSIRYWDFKDIFNDSGSIKPDIYVDNSINDLENNYDRMISESIKLLNKK
jgi:hypothetical protein